MSQPVEPHASRAHGRMLIFAGAILWSLSGGFTKLLTKPSIFELNEPAVEPLQIAYYRCLFAGLALVPFLRRADLSF